MRAGAACFRAALAMFFFVLPTFSGAFVANLRASHAKLRNSFRLVTHFLRAFAARADAFAAEKHAVFHAGNAFAFLRAFAAGGLASFASRDAGAVIVSDCRHDPSTPSCSFSPSPPPPSLTNQREGGAYFSDRRYSAMARLVVSDRSSNAGMVKRPFDAGL